MDADARLELHLLGPVTVLVAGRPIPSSALAGRHGRLVLSHLAALGVPVHRDALAETLWGDQLPATWLRTLSSVISRLRTALSEAASGSVTITYDAGFYSFEPADSIRVDVASARSAVAAARSAQRAGDWDRVANLTGTWTVRLRKPVAPELDTNWANQLREEMAQLSIEAAVLASTAARHQGRHGDAVRAAREAVQSGPLWEQAHRALMLALAGSGDRAGALAAYAACRERVVDELGVEPDPETQRLHLALLHDEATHSADDARPARSVTVTFVLTDIASSTRLWARAPEVMPAVITAHERLIADAVSACGGRLLRARGEGDSTFSVFKDPVQAMRAAVRLQTAIEANAWPSGLPLTIRVGVHTGVAEEYEDDYLGFEVSRAARLRSLANGGQILVSGSTVDAVAVPPDVRITRMGRYRLADVGAVEVYQLESADAEHRPMPLRLGGMRPPFPGRLSDLARSPLFGRDAELSWLWSAWQRAMDSTVAVALSGPAGIGKSHLAAQFTHQLHQAGAAVFYISSRESSDVLADAIAACGQIVKTLPLVLVIDDGLASLSIVQNLLSERAAPTMLLVCAPQPPSDAGQVLNLRGLDLDGVEALLEWSSGLQHTRDMLDLVAHETSGSPGAVITRGRELARSATSTLASQTTSARESLRELEGQLAAALSRSTPDTPQSRPSLEPPYRGLLRYEPDDAGVFFGRDELIAQITAHLLTSRFLAVIGSSGSGKSSLVRAGLVPALRARQLPGMPSCRVLLAVPGSRPLESLATALGLTTTSGLGPSDVAAHLATSVVRDERVVIIVDQFEELFTACDDEAERRATVDLLLGLAESASKSVSIVITLRSDFYDRSASVPALAARLQADQVLVGTLSEPELRRAIEGPARAMGVVLEEGLVDRIVADVSARSGALPLMSTSLLETWRLRDNDTMTLASYHASGGVEGAVARLAESVYERFNESERLVARTVMLRLAAAGAERDVRRRVRREELVESDDSPAAHVLASLVRRRLVVAHEDAYEVAHEALFREWPRLRSWLEEDADGQRLLSQLAGAANEWQRRGRDPSELFRGTKLVDTQHWAARAGHRLNSVEQDFLTASQEAAQRSAQRVRRTNRRLRLLAAGLTVVLAGVAVAAYKAVQSSRQASQEATRAIAERLVATATGSGAADLRLLLAVEARRLSPTAETNGALLTALNDVSRVRRFLNDSAPVAAIALSPDGTTIATGDRRGIISFWRSGPSLSELGRVRSSAAVTAIAFSPDGRRLAAAGTDGRIHEWAVGTRRALTSFAADVGTVLQLRWTASGSRLQSFGADHLLRSFAATTGRSVSITSVAAGTQVTLPVADGPTVLSAGRAVRIMTPSGDRPVQTVVTAPSVVTAGPTAVLVGGPGAVTVSSVSGGPRASVRLRAPAGLGSALPSACAVTDDGTTALVAYGSVVVRYDLASGRQLGEPSSVPGVKTISTLRSHDASTAVAVNTDGRVAVLDLDGSALSSPLTSLGGAVSAIALSPDGKVIAIGDAAGEIQVTDGRTGTTRLRLHSAGRALNALAFSPDGALLADGDGDAVLGGAITGSVSVWRTADGRLLARARVPGLVSVSSVAFSSNRDLALVTAAGAGWQWKGLHSFAPLHVDGADSPVTAVAARPRGALLLALRGGEVLEQRGSSTDIAMHAPSSSDRLAEDAAGKAIVALGADDPLLRTTAGDLYTVVDPLGPVQVGALSDDGSTAAFVSDGLVSLWDVRSRSPIGSALPVTGVTAVAFAADGRHLVTGTSSGDVEVWQISPQAWVAVACRVAARRLTPAEWRTYLLGRAYRPAC